MMMKIVLFIVSLLWYSGANAASSAMVPSNAFRGVPAQCWEGAAQYHQVDLWLLYSIAIAESGMNPRAINVNRNGTQDLGMFQINSIWLPELAKTNIYPKDLMDGCVSIYVGAWILSKNIRSHGYNWYGIGSYNSRKPDLALAYAKKIYKIHAQITGIPNTYKR